MMASRVLMEVPGSILASRSVAHRPTPEGAWMQHHGASLLYLTQHSRVCTIPETGVDIGHWVVHVSSDNLVKNGVGLPAPRSSEMGRGRLIKSDRSSTEYSPAAGRTGGIVRAMNQGSRHRAVLWARCTNTKLQSLASGTRFVCVVVVVVVVAWRPMKVR